MDPTPGLGGTDPGSGTLGNTGLASSGTPGLGFNGGRRPPVAASTDTTTGAYSSTNPAPINQIPGLMSPTSTGGGAYNNGSALPFNPVQGIINSNPAGLGGTSNVIAPDAGPAIYGTQGNQTLADWQKEQSNTFNSNQLAAQGQYNTALGQMPYNTQINGPNPYNQYVANPATPGQPSAAFQSPENTQAWQQSGLSQSLAQPNTGFGQSQPQNAQYGQNQLNYLLNALQLYGPGGQNRFGNGFSPLLTGAGGTQGNLGGLGSTSTNSTSNGINLSVLLPLLLGLAQRGPAAGTYGNLGVPQSNTASQLNGQY